MGNFMIADREEQDIQYQHVLRYFVDEGGMDVSTGTNLALRIYETIRAREKPFGRDPILAMSVRYAQPHESDTGDEAAKSTDPPAESTQVETKEEPSANEGQAAAAGNPAPKPEPTTESRSPQKPKTKPKRSLNNGASYSWCWTKCYYKWNFR